MKEIPLTQGKFALIDDDMFDRVSYFKWHVVKKLRTTGIVYYALTNIYVNGKYTCLLMHRLIMGIPDPLQVDHRNSNGLNNQKHNLRICTGQQNSQNSRKTTNSTSIYKGVSYVTKKNKWRSRIMVNGNPIHLGYYGTEIQAAIAYNNSAIKYFGDFALLNMVPLPGTQGELELKEE